MTAKKRARNRNKKAAAAAAAANTQAEDAENRSSTPTTTKTTLTTAIVSPDNIKEEEADMCNHELNLEFSNEDFKQTVKDLCDDATSDLGKVQRVIYGKGLRDQAAKAADGCVAPTAAYGAVMKDFLSLSFQDEVEVSEEEVLANYGITFILAYKFPDEDDYASHKWMISHFVSEGTKCLLRGDIHTARGNAIFANFFEQTLNFYRGKMMSGPKLMRFLNADEHTLCSYFRNRIPCCCLDKKYKEVKSVVKKDMCWNAKCKKPNRFEIDSDSMLTCSGCRQAIYCSSKCQEVDWRVKHKKDCGLHKEAVDIFCTKANTPLKNNTFWKEAVSPQLSKYLPRDELKRIENCSSSIRS